MLDRRLGEFSIIGSSYGGLVAIHYAKRFGKVGRMLLLAPGLRWLSGRLSEDQLEAWKQAGAVPIPTLRSSKRCLCGMTCSWMVSATLSRCHL